MKSRALPILLPALALLPILASLVACHRDPQEKILALRSRYTVETRGWQIREANPLAAAGGAGTALSERAEETDAMSAAIDGEDPAETPVEPSAPAGPRRVEVAFEVNVTRRGAESLPGITLDVVQSDAFRQVKKVYRHYLELPEAAGGEGRNLAFAVLADGFVDGDVFALALREEVPPEERSEYRELR